MIRQIVIPTDNRLVLELPDNYLNQLLEVIIFSIEEAVDKSPDKTPIDDEDLRLFHKYRGCYKGKFNREELYDRFDLS